ALAGGDMRPGSLEPGTLQLLQPALVLVVVAEIAPEAGDGLPEGRIVSAEIAAVADVGLARRGQHHAADPPDHRLSAAAPLHRLVVPQADIVRRGDVVADDVVVDRLEAPGACPLAALVDHQRLMARAGTQP